jgi:hypothetical protein
VVGAKLKYVYWITQHKDWDKGKNRGTLKTAGRRQEAWHGIWDMEHGAWGMEHRVKESKR